MNRDRLMYHCENWQQMHKSSGEDLGIKSPNIYGGSGVHSTDDMGERVDAWAANEMETIINDLPRPQRTAMHHAWLGARFFWPTHDYDLETAYENIMRKGSKRGLA